MLVRVPVLLVLLMVASLVWGEGRSVGPGVLASHTALPGRTEPPYPGPTFEVAVGARATAVADDCLVSLG
jgi:hypothetical protein